MVHFHYPHVSIANVIHIGLVRKKSTTLKPKQVVAHFRILFFYSSIVILEGINIKSSQGDICINMYMQHLWIYSLIKARTVMSFVQNEVKDIFPACISFGTPVSSLKST